MMLSDDLSGAKVLLEAHKLITGARQASYAHPSKDYLQTRDIFEAMTGVSLTVEEAILFMVAVKLSRLRTALASGQIDCRDTIIDAAGYIGCLAMVLDTK